jgi:sugar lactone lactonase YvrE
VIRLRATELGGAACELGEGVIFDPRTGGLAWVDILAGRILTAALDGDRLLPTAEQRLDTPVGAIAPRAGADGWIAAAGDGIALVDGDGGLEWLDRPEARADGATRMNDAACDPGGCFWAGSMAYDATPGAGSLYRLDPAGGCERVLDGLTIANGVGWSPDGTTLYLADSGAGRIEAFACDLRTGRLSDRRVLADFSDTDHGPDGLCVDAGGTVWTALWGGAAVLAVRPDGSRAAWVELGTPQPTSCAIAPGAGRMVISTATHGLEPAATGTGGGRLWTAAVPAQGQPQYAWPG